jgi:hypothetical protein
VRIKRNGNNTNDHNTSHREIGYACPGVLLRKQRTARISAYFAVLLIRTPLIVHSTETNLASAGQWRIEHTRGKKTFRNTFAALTIS